MVSISDPSPVHILTVMYLYLCTYIYILQCLCPWQHYESNLQHLVQYNDANAALLGRKQGLLSYMKWK